MFNPMIDNPRIEYLDDHKTYKEVSMHLLDEEYAIRIRIKKKEEAIPVAERYLTKVFKFSDDQMTKVMSAFEKFKKELEA